MGSVDGLMKVGIFGTIDGCDEGICDKATIGSTEGILVEGNIEGCIEYNNAGRRVGVNDCVIDGDTVGWARVNAEGDNDG